MKNRNEILYIYCKPRKINSHVGYAYLLPPAYVNLKYWDDKTNRKLNCNGLIVVINFIQYANKNLQCK